MVCIRGHKRTWWRQRELAVRNETTTAAKGIRRGSTGEGEGCVSPFSNHLFVPICSLQSLRKTRERGHQWWQQERGGSYLLEMEMEMKITRQSKSLSWGPFCY